MCLCGTDVQHNYFVSPDGYQYRLYLSTDSQFCIQLGTPISTPTTRVPFIPWLYFIYQYTGQIISFQMITPLRSFDDVDGKERGQKKTDDLRAMTALGPRTLHIILIVSLSSVNPNQCSGCLFIFKFFTCTFILFRFTHVITTEITSLISNLLENILKL